MPPTPEENKAIVRRYAEVIWNNGQLTALEEFVDDDYVLQESDDADAIRGAEGLRVYIESILDAFPDHSLEIEDMVAEDDLVSWCWRMQGTHRGPFLGIPATGRRVTTTGIAMYRLADGKIVERFGEADMLGLLSQLGRLPFDSVSPLR